MGLVSVERRKISYATIAVLVNTLRANEKESRVFDTLLSLSLGRGRGQGQGESRHPDPTTRPPDTPRQVQEMQADASRCKGAQADARGCKRMQAIKQGGRGKGVGARGKGVAALAKGRKRKKPWRFQRGLMLLRGLMRQGSFAPLARLLPPAPLTPPPSPLPPCFSGCIPLSFPFHSACAFPFHSACIPLSFPAPALGCRGVGWSGRGVGSVGPGRGGVKFAPPSLSLGGRFSVLRPPQSVCSNQIVNIPPLIGKTRQPKLILLV